MTPLNRRHCWIKVLEGGRRNDRGIHFRAGQQLAMVGGEEVGLAVLCELAADFFVDIGYPQPRNARKISRQKRANAADDATADDCQPNFFLLCHVH